MCVVRVKQSAGCVCVSRLMCKLTFGLDISHADSHRLEVKFEGHRRSVPKCQKGNKVKKVKGTKVEGQKMKNVHSCTYKSALAKREFI